MSDEVDWKTIAVKAAEAWEENVSPWNVLTPEEQKALDQAIREAN